MIKSWRTSFLGATVMVALLSGSPLAMGAEDIPVRETPVPETPVLTDDRQIDEGNAGTYQVRNGPIKNRFTGRCVDDSAAYGLRSFSCNGLDFQRWDRRPSYFPNYALANLNTGSCLDDSSYGLRAIPCNGYGYQRWLIQDRGNGIEIQNAQTAKCLDDSSYGLRTFVCNNTQFQRFNF